GLWGRMGRKPHDKSQGTKGAKPGPRMGILRNGVTRADITLTIRMPAACLHACWLTPCARTAPACIDRPHTPRQELLPRHTPLGRTNKCLAKSNKSAGGRAKGMRAPLWAD